MAYKRHIDRLPIIPADAQKHNVTCHYCIVGCGYHAYTWPVNKQGGAEPASNAFGVDLSVQQPAETAAWYPPSMYNIVKKNGQDVHIVIKPDPDCEVNSGLGSVRGARMGELRYSAARNSQLAASDRPDGLALRPDAADLLGRCARSGGSRHGGGHQGPRRGWPVRLGVRPWRFGRRLREHLGHRKALFRLDEDQEHPHTQPPGLQFGSSCHARHGRRGTEQLLRGCRTRGHAGLGRQQSPGDADQLLPQSLGSEPSRDIAGQEKSTASRRAARTARR